MLTTKQMKRLDNLDKRAIAYHEAGHATVAAALGCWRIRVHIEPTGFLDIERKSWCGQMTCGGTCSVVAVAGYVGTCFVDDPDPYESEMFSRWGDEGGPSSTDLLNIPEDIDLRWEALHRAAEILRTEHRLFRALIAALLKHQMLTDFQVNNLAKRLLVARPISSKPAYL